MVQTTYPSEAKTVAVVEVLNDGRPDFAANPFNGPAPTYEQALAAVLCGARAGGELRRLEGAWIHGQRTMPAPGQRRIEAASSLQHQQQLAELASAFSGRWAPSRRWRSTTSLRRAATKDGSSRTSNILFNPATGINYPFSNRSLLPYPEFGVVAMTVQNGRSTYHALQTAFTKRMSNRWQASATYTLGGLWDALGKPLQGAPGSTPALVRFRAGA